MVSLRPSVSRFRPSVRVGLMLAAVAASVGCASMFDSSRSSSSSSSSSGPYLGPITIQNQTSHAICGADFYDWETSRTHESLRFADNPIAAGASREFPRSLELSHLRLLECDNTHVLFESFTPYNTGFIFRIRTTNGVLTVVESGNRDLDGDDVTLIAQRHPLSAYRAPAGALQNEQGNAVAQNAQQLSAGRITTPVEWSVVPSNDYEIERNNSGMILRREFRAWLGSRDNRGCFAQLQPLYNQWEGNGYSSNIRHEGGQGPTMSIPCEAFDLIAGRAPGSSAPATSSSPAAPAAPASGRCDNTCRTANDNECDDGGPGSLYSVCALGTDCNDCGPR